MFIDKERTAEIVSLSPKAIERLVQRGHLRGYKVAGSIVWRMQWRDESGRQRSRSFTLERDAEAHPGGGRFESG